MWKKLAYLGLFVGVSAAAWVACTSGPNDPNNTKPDFATSNSDGGPNNNDMNVMKTYMSATPNEIDTNTIGGSFGKGTAVQLSGLIVLAPPYGFASNSKMDCKYEVYAQDPTCSTPPCGILLVTPAITNPNGTGMFCPFAKDTSTALKNIWQGDKVDVKGVVDTFASTATAPATGTVVQHSITIDELTQVSTKQALPTPLVVTDDTSSATSSKFVPYSGSGWAMYESMLIELKPASGKFTTTLDMYGGWTTAPGGAHFADDFTSFFRPDGAAANMYPPNGSMFSSISGIVGTTFGGGILPTSPDAFQP